MSKDERQRERGRIQTKPDYVVVRHIPDLEHMCMNMGTSILRTCKQIHQEASAMFWGENVWRFSGDPSWLTIWRFLKTIGPTNRTLLRAMELHPVFLNVDEPFPRIEYGTKLPHFKNHPKLHMSARPRWSKQYDWFLATRDVMSSLKLERLNFVVTTGCRLHHLSSDRGPGLPGAGSQRVSWHQAPTARRPTPCPRDWHVWSWDYWGALAKLMTLIIERGARFDQLAAEHAVGYNNINMISEKGYFLALERGHPMFMPPGNGGYSDTSAEDTLADAINAESKIGHFVRWVGQRPIFSWQDNYFQVYGVGPRSYLPLMEARIHSTVQTTEQLEMETWWWNFWFMPTREELETARWWQDFRIEPKPMVEDVEKEE